MTYKLKRRSLRCGGRPKADFGSLFTSVIAPALNVTGSVVDESINKYKTTTSGVVNSNTTIPSDPTKTSTMKLGGRKKCWIGAAIGAATSIAGSLFGNGAQKREMRRQKSIQDWQDATQEAASMSSALNNSRDYQDDYLRQFRTAARLGKTLGAKGIYITDGGDATKIGHHTYLLRGGSHEDVNETGLTGIGINVGGNEVEAEGGEVVQKKNGTLRIFSAQPILSNGMSPAQAVMNGASKDKVFTAQQRFKKNNGIKDDGSKAQVGGYYGANYPSPLSLLSVIYDKALGRFDDKNPFIQTGIAPTPSRGLNLKQVRNGLVNRNMLRTNRVYRIANMREVKDAKAIGQYRKLPEGVTLPTKTVRTRSGRTFEFGRAGGNSHGGKAAAMGEPWTGTTSSGYNESKYVISTPSRHTVWQVGHQGSYSKPLPADAIKQGSGLWKKFDAEGNTGISTKRMVVYKDLGNGRYLRLDKSKYRLGGLTSKDFASGSRSYPSLRKKSLLDSYNRPVKGMRPKAPGGMYIPYNKRYSSIYDAPDHDYDYDGGNALGDNEAVVIAKRIKPTFMKPNNDAMNLIKVPKEEEVPYIPQRHNRSRTIFSGGDYLGLGIDTLAALSTGLINYNTAGKYSLPDRAPIIQASKLPTTYNVNPEIEEVKRYRDRLTGQTFNNTSSSVAALNRSNAINLDALSNLSKLWATKENEENKMLTEDAKNQQTVAAQNVQNELARQSEIARIKNEAAQAKGDALNVGLSGLSQAWTNFWTAGRTAYEDDQSRRAMIASSKEATPTRLSEMDFDLSPDILASLYRTSKDDRTKRFYLSRLSPKQRLKYGIN